MAWAWAGERPRTVGSGQLAKRAPPPQLVGAVLHQGCKMILGGTSKSYKSWCLLDFGLSVSSGAE